MEYTEIKTLFADVYHRFMTLGETSLKEDQQSSLNHFLGQPDGFQNTLQFNRDGYDVVCRTKTDLICYHHHGLMESRSIERKSI
jgi:hypothetical protein